MPDAAPPTCPRCGSPRSAAGPDGPCPHCSPEDALSDAADATGSFRDEARGGVLETLAAAAGPIPRILLHDTRGEVGGSPVVRPASPEMPAPSARPARVQLLGEIARGGMGVILKGRDPDLGRDLAVKVLRESHRDQPEMVRRFVEEAQIAGQLQHPGVVPVHELGCFDDLRPYFTMKLVKGRTLAQILADRPAAGADRSRLLGVFEQVTQTVAYAHARGVIHRDLKPSNVMVGAFGEVQVMDWGLAKVLPRGGAADDASAGRAGPPAEETVIATARSGTDSDLSRAGSVLGTPSYMAPEQARGEIESVDERSDVFALGSILCEMLTGQPAFSGRNSGEIQRKAARGDLADATARLAASGADAELAGLARDCLAAEPGDRPRDAGAVAERLTSYLAGVRERLHASELAHAAEVARAEEATRTAEAAQALARAERRTRRLTAALAAVAIGMIALGGGGAAWFQHRRVERSAVLTRAVNDALAEAMRREGEAQAAAIDDPTRWGLALAEARRADDLLQQGEADVFLRRRVAAVLVALTQKRDEAAQRADRDRVDRNLMAALRRAHSGDHGQGYIEAAERAYDAAFLDAGLDVDALSPEEVGKWIAARSASADLIAFLDDWTHLRRILKLGAGKRPWAHLVAAARAADPDPWRNTLRAGLADTSALLALADDEAALQGRSAVSLNLLGVYLKDAAADLDRAERVLRLAWLRHPDDYWINYHIAEVLAARRPASPELLGRLQDDRIRFLTAAVAAKPDSEHAYTHLGIALWERGKIDEAIAAYREEIRRHPDDTAARSRLVGLLVGQGKSDEVVTILRDVLRRGGAGVDYYNAGLALEAQGKRGDALAAYREAARLDGDGWGEAIFSLGEMLRRLGRYDEAAAAFRRAADVSRRADLPDQVVRAEDSGRRVAFQGALSGRLPGLLKGTDHPKDGAELYEIGWLCIERRLYVAGERIFDLAFRADPKLVDDLDQAHRYNAACLAALAGSREGADASPPDESEKARLRARALDWLRADLAAWSKPLEGGTPADRARVAANLSHWKTDADLADVRLPIALARLPGPEREAWEALWGKVDALLAKAKGENP